MTKLKKIIFGIVLALLLFIAVVAINDRTSNSQKADLFRSRYNEIQLPSYLSPESSSWDKALLPDSRDTLNITYKSNNTGSGTLSDLTSALKNEGYRIISASPYKSTSRSSEYSDSFGSVSGTKTQYLNVEFYVTGKGPLITVKARVE